MHDTYRTGTCRPKVQISMTDKDIIQRVADILGVKSFWTRQPARPGWKVSYQLTVNGQRAVDLMMRIRPMMGERRREQIDAAVSGWAPRKIKNAPRDKEILSRRQAGESYSAIGRAMELSPQLVRGVVWRAERREVS